MPSMMPLCSLYEWQKPNKLCTPSKDVPCFLNLLSYCRLQNPAFLVVKVHLCPVFIYSYVGGEGQRLLACLSV